jgi:hypothetical protein
VEIVIDPVEMNSELEAAVTELEATATATAPAVAGPAAVAGSAAGEGSVVNIKQRPLIYKALSFIVNKLDCNIKIHSNNPVNIELRNIGIHIGNMT